MISVAPQFARAPFFIICVLQFIAWWSKREAG